MLGRLVSHLNINTDFLLESRKIKAGRFHFINYSVLTFCFYISGCDSMKVISYSDVSSCVKGCNEMRKLQKNQVIIFIHFKC